MKAFEQYFHVVLFIMLHKVVLTFESVDATLVCAIQIIAYQRAALSCCTVYNAEQGTANFCVCE